MRVIYGFRRQNPENKAMEGIKGEKKGRPGLERTDEDNWALDWDVLLANHHNFSKEDLGDPREEHPPSIVGIHDVHEPQEANERHRHAAEAPTLSSLSEVSKTRCTSFERLFESVHFLPSVPSLVRSSISPTVAAPAPETIIGACNDPNIRPELPFNFHRP
jgi:hypothetical protein